MEFLSAITGRNSIFTQECSEPDSAHTVRTGSVVTWRT